MSTLRHGWGSSYVLARTIKRKIGNTSLLTPRLPYVQDRHQMKYVRWKLRALERVILLWGIPPSFLDAWLRRMDISQGPWPSPAPHRAPRASPRAVGVLADEQCLSRAADAAVGLVPVLIVQEEVVPELVLGESKAASASSAPRGLPSRPSAPGLPCRGSTSRPRTGGAACAPGSSHSRCTALRGQPRGNGVTTPPGRATELERHLTKEVQGPYTGTPKRHWKKNRNNWEAVFQVMV